MVKQKGHKVVAAAARAAKNKQFKAFQQKTGLLSDKDGEESTPSTPRRQPHGDQWYNLCSRVMGVHQGNGLPRWIRTRPPWSRYPCSPPICSH